MTDDRRIRPGAVLLALALPLVAVGCETEEQTAKPSPTIRVEEVIDGDTVVLTRFGKTRLIGVNTPEEGKCGDNAATRFTRRELEGEQVKYELGVEAKDRYDRTLAYLTREARMHNLALVEEGYAKALTIPPNDKYADQFEDAERQAEEQEEGPQADCAEKRRRVVARKRARARERAEARRRDVRAARRLRAAAKQARAAERRAERRARRQRSGGSSGGGSSGAGSSGAGSSGGGSGGIPKNCSGVDGPIPTPPGDPTNLDGNDDGQACE